jgi:hypothetical protein
MGMVFRTFCSLEGYWKLSRIITNQGFIEGIAYFKKKAHYPDTLFYREKGMFTPLNGKSLDISQEYEYRYSKEKISVFFARERYRLLHSLEFAEPNKALGEHQCGCDTYRATYQFALPDEFELTYVVKGPKKDYQIKTIFKKSLPKV